MRYGYTQNEEEKYIVEAVKHIPNGRFLDIGAHDGKTFSSTRALLEKGWGGVYVEPSPHVLPALYANSEEFREKVQILPCAVGTQGGILPFYSSGSDMVGSLSQQHVVKWSPFVKFTETRVRVVTLHEIEYQCGTNFDFVNLDVEGINWDIFLQFDWKKWRPACVCIEYDEKRDQIAAILKQHGYNIVYISGENIVATRTLTGG